MTPADALARLRASRDADRDAPVWGDDGRSVRMLAEAAPAVLAEMRRRETIG